MWTFRRRPPRARISPIQRTSRAVRPSRSHRHRAKSCASRAISTWKAISRSVLASMFSTARASRCTTQVPSLPAMVAPSCWPPAAPTCPRLAPSILMAASLTSLRRTPAASRTRPPATTEWSSIRTAAPRWTIPSRSTAIAARRSRAPSTFRAPNWRSTARLEWTRTACRSCPGRWRSPVTAASPIHARPVRAHRPSRANG